MEIDALDTTRDVKSIGAQAAAQAWNAQRVSILLWIQATQKHLKFNSMKGKMNEARVVDFSGMRRKEGVNRVSKLSKLSICLFLCGPYQSAITNRAVEATSNKRRQAHYHLLRKVKTDIDGWRNHEKVNASPSKARPIDISLQVVTDAKAMVRRYKKLVKK